MYRYSRGELHFQARMSYAIPDLPSYFVPSISAGDDMITTEYPVRLSHWHGERFGIVLVNNIGVHFDTTLEEAALWRSLIAAGHEFTLRVRHNYKDISKAELIARKPEAL